jgi:glutaredoxin-related protein
MTRQQITLNGHSFDLDAVVNLMDDEIREELHARNEWPSEQAFVDAYCAEHAKRFNETFVVN